MALLVNVSVLSARKGICHPAVVPGLVEQHELPCNVVHCVLDVCVGIDVITH